MSTPGKAMLGLLAAAAAVVVLARVFPWGGDPARPAGPGDGGPSASIAGQADLVAPGGEERALPPDPPAEIPEEEEEEDELWIEEWITDEEVVPLPPLRGRVVDLHGTGVGGVPVLYVPFGQDGEGLQPEISDAGGWFRFDEPHPSGQIDAVGDAWTTLFQPRILDPAEHGEPVLVVAPAIHLAGLVSGEEEVPLEGARIRVRIPDAARAGLDLSLEGSHSREILGTTDEEGLFELSRVPAVEGAQLVTQRPGYQPDRRPLPASSELGLRIELRPLHEVICALRGCVLDGEGAAVEDAWVSLGGSSAPTDEAGGFELFVQREGDRILRAAAPWSGAASLAARPGVELSAAFPDPLVLVIEDGSQTLSGRVLRASGEPAPGAQVWTPDTTPFGRVPLDLDAHEWAIDRSVESMVSGETFGIGAEADGAGRFELTGLLDHAYVVCAFDPQSLSFAQSAPARPGEEVVLRLPKGEVHARVAGRVLDLHGVPVEGADVRFGVEVTAVPSLAGREPETDWRYGRDTKTDSEGRFEVRELSRAARWIWIGNGELAESFEGDLDPDADLDNLEYRLALRCRLQVITAGEPRPDALRVLDASGEPLPLRARRGWVEDARERRVLTDGRSEILRTSQLASTLVLLRGEDEVMRVPLSLEAGELNVVRP